MEIRVVNRHHKQPVAPGATRVYIGRGSPLGNPFRVKPHGPYSRDEAITKFARYALTQGPGTPFYQELERLAALVRDGQGLELECFCAPRRCHGDIIAAMVQELAA